MHGVYTLLITFILDIFEAIVLAALFVVVWEPLCVLALFDGGWVEVGTMFGLLTLGFYAFHLLMILIESKTLVALTRSVTEWWENRQQPMEDHSRYSREQGKVRRAHTA